MAHGRRHRQGEGEEKSNTGYSYSVQVDSRNVPFFRSGIAETE
jgi:hypothetical protein